MKKEKDCWSICKHCKGLGEKKRTLNKKERTLFKKELEAFKLNPETKIAPLKPKVKQVICSKCTGTGINSSDRFPKPDTKNHPHVAIIGAGIGGIAFAVACLHRGIPFTLFEKDKSFNERSQGYGLTLQQASKALESFGIGKLQKGIVSTKHVVHKTDGTVIGEWGKRKWVNGEKKSSSKKTNIHIARQNLRLELLHQLGSEHEIKWGHEFVSHKKLENENLEITFKHEEHLKHLKTNLIVGADGIRSNLRELIFTDAKTPLRYLNCMVILGICSLEELSQINNPLLDSETVFQTANGKERIYVMPFDSSSVMWQLSFPVSEASANKLSKLGAKHLKVEAIKRTNWHNPIPELIKATKEHFISGYPVYDRELLKPDAFKNVGNITLIGDAAHPMSPFKGQGANQALLDALELSKTLSKTTTHWKEEGLRPFLTKFETKMLKRSAIKVKASAEAAKALHSKQILIQSDNPRGKFL